MATSIDTNYMRSLWLPRVNADLSNPRFGAKRSHVHRVSVCAVVVSQDEAEIGHLLKTEPSFAVTQEKLDWQPDDDLDDQNEGDVYQHLLRMSDSEDPRLRRTHDCYFLANVTSPVPALHGDSEPCSSPSSTSLRASRLTIYNAPAHENKLGYYIGQTAVEAIAALGGSTGSLPWWFSTCGWNYHMPGWTPKLVTAQEKLKTAVLWQVQVDIVHLSSRPLPLSRRRPRKRYGPFLQVHGEEWLPESRENGAAPEAKRFKCVRWRPERKRWVAEMRLPNQVRKEKVTFGEFKSQNQAARAVDAVYFYYGKQEQVQFPDSARVLPELPAGLEVEAKLKFVKREAKRLAHWDPTLPASVNAQEIPAGHTAVSDLSCLSPTPPTSAVPNTLICSTSGVGGSVEMHPEMFLAPEMSLEQSFSNNLEAGAEPVDLEVQTMLRDQLSCGMGSGVGDLVDGDSAAPDWFPTDSILFGFDGSLLGFEDGNMNSGLLESQSLQDLFFQGW